MPDPPPMFFFLQARCGRQGGPCGAAEAAKKTSIGLLMEMFFFFAVAASLTTDATRKKIEIFFAKVVRVVKTGAYDTHSGMG